MWFTHSSLPVGNSLPQEFSLCMWLNVMDLTHRKWTLLSHLVMYPSRNIKTFWTLLSKPFLCQKRSWQYSEIISVSVTWSVRMSLTQSTPKLPALPLLCHVASQLGANSRHTVAFNTRIMFTLFLFGAPLATLEMLFSNASSSLAGQGRWWRHATARGIQFRAWICNILQQISVSKILIALTSFYWYQTMVCF